MRILNVRNLNPEGLVGIRRFCRESIADGKGAFLIPMNPIKVIKARNHPDFQEIIDGAEWVFPDAWGIKWAASLLYGEDIELSPGYRVMFTLLRQAEEDGHSVFMLGTRSEILDSAVEILKKEYPGLIIAGTHHGFFDDDEEETLFREIAGSDPRYVFVAMGEYRQEKVIQKLKKVHPGAVYLGVGGSIDLVAGRQPSPPEWMRRRHLEWVFRLVRQPFRLPRFKALPVFAALVVAEKFGLRSGS
jgi:N-acetylglucosaminyldiphosphoundecaprenol N-acetyl-beta-D-mannosaminyltransferase